LLRALRICDAATEVEVFSKAWSTWVSVSTGVMSNAGAAGLWRANLTGDEGDKETEEEEGKSTESRSL